LFYSRRERVNRTPLNDQPASLRTRLARRATLRDAVLRWITPFCAARMIFGSAAVSTSPAFFASPAARASSTWRRYVRICVRRALLTSVRRAMTRVAFFADFVLAILSDLIADSREPSRQLPKV